MVQRLLGAIVGGVGRKRHDCRLSRMHELGPLSSPRAIRYRQSIAAPRLHPCHRPDGDNGGYDSWWRVGTLFKTQSCVSRMQLWLASFLARPDGSSLGTVRKN